MTSRKSSSRGMVTAELAIGILTATMLTISLAWGIHLIAIQTECADVAAQVARAEARGDAVAAAMARDQAPVGAAIEVDRSGSQVRVSVTIEVSFGHLINVTVSGHATMPKEPGT